MPEEPRGWLWCDAGAVTSFAGVDGIPGCEGSGTGQCILWEIGLRLGFSRGKDREKKSGRNGEKWWEMEKMGKKGGKGEKWEKLGKNGKKWKKWGKWEKKGKKGIFLSLVGLWLRHSERGFALSPPPDAATPLAPNTQAQKQEKNPPRRAPSPLTGGFNFSGGSNGQRGGCSPLSQSCPGR